MVEANKISKLNFISSDSVQLRSKKIGGHKDTVCSNCGSKTTTGGWFKTYNKDRSWDIEKYHCNACHYYFNLNTGEFSKIPEGRKIGEHKNTICSDCNSKTTSGYWYKKRDKNRNWDKELYICTACYHNSAYRSGELNPDSNVYKGMIGVHTVAKVLGDKDCTIMKQGSSFDIYSIQSLKYGKIEVKTTTYSPEYGHWMAGSIKSGLFDTLFIICVDNKFENVIRIYIISRIEVGNVKTIAIIENPSKCGWYKEFRIDDIVQYQEAFRIVKNESQISENYVNNSQDFMSTKEKGDICEEIVKIAINAKTSIDIRYDLIHEGYKKIEVKGSDCISRYKRWFIGGIEPFKFDTLFIVCMSSNFEKVERVYIISNEKVNVSGITIYKDSSRDGWYKKFRVDEKPYQLAYERILEM